MQEKWKIVGKCKKFVRRRSDKQLSIISIVTWMIGIFVSSIVTTNVLLAIDVWGNLDGKCIFLDICLVLVVILCFFVSAVFTIEKEERREEGKK